MVIVELIFQDVQTLCYNTVDSNYRCVLVVVEVIVNKLEFQKETIIVVVAKYLVDCGFVPGVSDVFYLCVFVTFSLHVL